jgi:hypothetical protein
LSRGNIRNNLVLPGGTSCFSGNLSGKNSGSPLVKVASFFRRFVFFLADTLGFFLALAAGVAFFFAAFPACVKRN